MQIKRTGFVYRVAYAHTHRLSKPDKVSLCPLFWRFMFGFFIGVPLTYLAFFILSMIMRGCFFLFAGESLHFSNTADLDPFDGTFKRNTVKMPTIRGRRITPIVMILIGLVGWLAYEVGPIIVETIIDAAASATSATTSFVTSPTFLIVIATIVIVTLSLLWVLKTEAWTLLKAWLKAKKQKVCPIIEVVE